MSDYSDLADLVDTADYFDPVEVLMLLDIQGGLDYETDWEKNYVEYCGLVQSSRQSSRGFGVDS